MQITPITKLPTTMETMTPMTQGTEGQQAVRTYTENLNNVSRYDNERGNSNRGRNVDHQTRNS